MSIPDFSNGPVNTASCITYYFTSCFILLCATPFFLCFKTDIQWIFGHMTDTIKCTYLSTVQIFRILHQWYNLWQELRQLQPNGQRHTQLNINHRLPQTLPPQDKCIMEIQQQWISTPFEDQITVFQDLLQDLQVSNVEFSLDLHFPNVSQQRKMPHWLCTMTAHLRNSSRVKKDV